MKNFILSMAILFVSFHTLTAQELSKKEKKALLAEIKELKKSPEQFLKIKQNQESSDLIVDDQLRTISVLMKEVQVKEMKLSETKEILAATEMQLGQLIQTQKNLSSSGASNAPMNHQEKKYRVQIGLYENLDFRNLLDVPKFLVHEFVDGDNRYSIGNFNSEEEAQLFKVEMRKIGIKDAFVSTYTDGLRTDLPAATQPYKTPVVVVPVAKTETTPSTVNSGFNVKPAKYTNNIENEPNFIENGPSISNKPFNVVPNQPVPNQEDFQFKDESTKSISIKINPPK
jgi:hypothetical protein